MPPASSTRKKRERDDDLKRQGSLAPSSSCRARASGQRRPQACAPARGTAPPRRSASRFAVSTAASPDRSGRDRRSDTRRSRTASTATSSSAQKASERRSKMHVRNRAAERREAGLDELDVVKAVVDLAYRQADEGDHHQHVAAKLIRNLEGKVEERPRQYVDADHDQHRDQLPRRKRACRRARQCFP